MMQPITHDDSDRLLPMASSITRGPLLAATETGGGFRPACHGVPESVGRLYMETGKRSFLGGAAG